MTGVDSSELLLLLLIGLIVLGPKRLPEIANKLGGWIGQARRMTRAMKRQLEDELRIDDKPTIHTPAMPPSVVADTPVPAAVADDAEEPEAHIPNDDDTYSPLHNDEAEGEKSA